MRGRRDVVKVVLLHLAIVAALAAAYPFLPDYPRGIFPRIMVLAVFAMGYNILFGYAGLLSLGHAMFFAAGLYGAGLTVHHFGWSVSMAFAAGITAGALLALAVGVLALRTAGVAFMIVTLMFAQTAYLVSIYFTNVTGGEEGLVIAGAARRLQAFGTSIDLTQPAARYYAALVLLSLVLAATLAIVCSPFGRTLRAIAQNEERVRMLGYDVHAAKLTAMVVSGALCAASGAAYTLLFGYVGSGFAAIQYSILPLLWVLLGGAATTLGPLLGTLVVFYLQDTASGYTSAYLLVVGAALILLTLFFPKGLLGTVREKALPWLP